MTKKEKSYIQEQLDIIQDKMNEEELSRYATLLSAAYFSEEVSGFLKRAVDKRLEELKPTHSPLVVGAEFDVE